MGGERGAAPRRAATGQAAGLERTPDDEAEERRLVAAARADRGAFAPLYRAYIAPVYRYLHGHTGDPHDAEDLAALTFGKALASLDRYEERQRFAAWLFGIARHTLRDHQRRRRRHLDLNTLAATLADPAPSPEAQILGAEGARDLHRRLAGLPAAQREALMLRFFGGLNTRDAAAVLGRSEGAVKMLVLRAIDRLREEYRAEEDR